MTELRPRRPRAARYSLVASITLTDLESGLQTNEKTLDLSLFGCHVVPGKTSAIGSRVRLQITHNGALFEALGQVANVRPTTGVGVTFIKVEGRYQLVLEKWLCELRKRTVKDHSQFRVE
jgi:hypothetical protein